MEVETPLNFTQFMRDGFDPVPELSRRRDECPVSRLDIPGGLTAWLVTRYPDVRAVLAAGGKFSNDFSNLARNLDDALGGVQLEPGGLGFSDPPMHTRFRRLLAPHFAPRRLRHLVPRIREIVAQQLNVMERAGPTVDLVEDFAVPIPSLVICELLGVPYA